MDGKKDEYYVSLAAKGDGNALAHILEAYKGMVINEARSFYIQGAEFEDVLQEGNIGLLKAIRTFDPSKSDDFSSFAKMSVRGQIISAVKTSTKKSNLALNESVSIDSEEGGLSVGKDIENRTDDTNRDPETIYLESEDRENLGKKMKNVLTPLEHGILVLLLEGYSYKQIAEKLDKNEKSVDNARRRIKKKLAEVMEREQ